MALAPRTYLKSITGHSDHGKHRGLVYLSTLFITRSNSTRQVLCIPNSNSHAFSGSCWRLLVPSPSDVLKLMALT